MQQPQTAPPPVQHPASSGGWVHGLIHGVQLFLVAFAIAIGVQPGKLTRDAIVIAIAAGIRGVFAAKHH